LEGIGSNVFREEGTMLPTLRIKGKRKGRRGLADVQRKGRRCLSGEKEERGAYF